jgi:hypothetical protein
MRCSAIGWDLGGFDVATSTTNEMFGASTDLTPRPDSYATHRGAKAAFSQEGAPQPFSAYSPCPAFAQTIAR